MGTIKYKKGIEWVDVSPQDIGAASTNIIKQGSGDPNSDINLSSDTVLYIDNNESIVEGQTVIRVDTDVSFPLDIDKGGTGAKTASAALKNLGIDVTSILESIYPVGSIYMSVNSTNPLQVFGFGTWKQIQGRFLVGVGNNNVSGNAALNIASAGATGGVAKHEHTTGNVTLTADQSGLPAHKHTVTPSSHDHTIKMRDNSGSGNQWAYKTEQGAFKYRNDYINSTTIATVSSTAKNASKAHNHGNTSTVTNIPPYYAVYIWERTK